MKKVNLLVFSLLIVLGALHKPTNGAWILLGGETGLVFIGGMLS